MYRVAGVLRDVEELRQAFDTGTWVYYVTVQKQIGHAQKCESKVFLQHHSSGTTMSSEFILGMAVIEG